MDVAKYIGLFLLKNSFVYIHGLGNLELRKKPAAYNGEVLQAPSYEIIVTSMGSIDDNLANFIATNEQISISKASNALREFSSNAREVIHGGKEVPIPGLGKFAEERGKTIFITDPGFSYSPPAIASMRVAKRQDDTPYTTNADIPAVKPRYIDPETEVEETSISWVKISAWVVGLIVLSAAIYFGIQYMIGSDATNEAPLIETTADSSTQEQNQPGMMDSTQTLTTEASDLLTFDVVLNRYTDLSKAKRRVDKLTSYGNNVQLVSEEDSSVFYVVLPFANISPADTSNLMDSLTRVFNPTYGVSILE